MRRPRMWSIVPIALLALSCATANQLSKRSERELAAGDLRGAYEHGRAAIAKQPSNARARAAYTAAATRLVDDRKARILTIAAVDTVAAAQQSLELAGLRAEIARYGVTLPPDEAFARQEAAIRLGAAHICYEQAERALRERRPKEAWTGFRNAQGFVSTYRDVGRRIEEAYALALARVAILPFADQAGVPGLSRALADRVHGELARHVQSDQFHFTRLLDLGDVYAQVTVAELDRISRADALRIGRRLGADQVVTGRVYGMRARTNTTTHRQTVFRKVVERDTAGTRRDRYVEYDFHGVVRERQVLAHYDLEVVDTRDGASLASYSDAVDGYARVVFTDFEPQGDCADYCLVPPSLKHSDPVRAASIEGEWKSHFGTWTLPTLLERARRDRHHTRYTPGDRAAFFSDCHERPVWLGDLPDENELATIALDDLWQPVFGMLKELDAK